MLERCPRCFTELGITGGWTDDPIKTPKGEAGDDYKGFTDIKPIHIQELQTLRAQQEIDAGIAEEDRTEFTEINIENNLVNFYRTHLLELRESTEKILTALGQTKDTYFNYDEDGTEYNIGNHQTDWTDPNLAERINKFVNIKAYHIEDLRHFLIVTVWFDDFIGITPTDIKSISSSMSLSGNGSTLQFQSDSDNFTEDLTDNKTDELENHMWSMSRCALQEKDYRNPLGTQNANANSSPSITRGVPITINLTASTSVSCDVHHLYGTDYAESYQYQQLTWKPTKFKNPSPNPNILITNNSRVYLDIIGTWSPYEWHIHGRGRTNRFTRIDIELWTVAGYILNIWLQPPIEVTGDNTFTVTPPLEGEWTGSAWRQLLVSGRNSIKIKEALDTAYPSYSDINKYFCKQIIVTFHSQAEAYLFGAHDSFGYFSESISSFMNINFNGIGIT